MLRTSFIVLLVFLGFEGYSQNFLKGIILEEKSNIPLPGVSIFINNTTIGTISDKNGEFLISFPTRNSIIVFKSLGYETQSKNISNFSSMNPIKIQLKKNFIGLQEVRVFPILDNGWKKYGELFRNLLIGTNPFAGDCKIKNEKSIHFRMNTQKHILMADADQDIIINNEALGYEIHYDLEKFAYNFRDTTIAFGGFARFKDLCKSFPNKRKEWLNNRKLVYCGSEMHFFRTVYLNQGMNEDFEIYRFHKSLNLLKQKAINYYKAGKDSRLLALSEDHVLDSTFHYKEYLRQPDSVILKILTSPDSLLQRLENSQVLFYSPDSLQIRYNYKGELPKPFKKYIKSYNNLPFTNFTFIHNKPIEIFQNGSLESIYDLQLRGFWFYCGSFSTLLPFDYWLE